MPARAWLWLTVTLTGGAFAVAVALAPSASAAPGRGLAWVLFAGSSVHVASTGWLYTLDDVRSYAASRSLRFCWAPAALVTGCSTCCWWGLVAAGSGARLVRLATLCNVALLGGVALEKASHLHGAALAGRLLFGAYLGAVMAHFVIDAGLWRLRDPFPRAFLARRVPSLVPGQHPAAQYRVPMDRQPI